MRKLSTLFIMACLTAVSAIAAPKITVLTDLDKLVKDGTIFCLRTGDTYLFNSGSHDTATGTLAEATDRGNNVTGWKLEKEGEYYRFAGYNAFGEQFTHGYSSHDEKKCWLNAQPSVGQVTFTLGINQDGEGSSDWSIDGNGYIKHALSGGYLAGKNTSATPVAWELVQVSFLEDNTEAVKGASEDKPLLTSFVYNGNFDANVKGWKTTTGATNVGIASNKQGAFTGNFFENWNAAAYSGKLYQVATEIPNGKYKLSICAFVNTADFAHQYVYANGDTTFLTATEPTAYEVVTVVKNNTIEYGLGLNTASQNWVGIDNVSLTYMGDTIATTYADLFTKGTQFTASIGSTISESSISTTYSRGDAGYTYYGSVIHYDGLDTDLSHAFAENMKAVAKDSTLTFNFVSTNLLEEKELWTMVVDTLNKTYMVYIPEKDADCSCIPFQQFAIFIKDVNVIKDFTLIAYKPENLAPVLYSTNPGYYLAKNKQLGIVMNQEVIIDSLYFVAKYQDYDPYTTKLVKATHYFSYGGLIAISNVHKDSNDGSLIQFLIYLNGNPEPMTLTYVLPKLELIDADFDNNYIRFSEAIKWIDDKAEHNAVLELDGVEVAKVPLQMSTENDNELLFTIPEGVEPGTYNFVLPDALVQGIQYGAQNGGFAGTYVVKATAIKTVEPEPVKDIKFKKVFENGRLYIINNGVKYDLTGKRIK